MSIHFRWLIAAVVASCCLLQAQETRATLLGHVTDPAGASIPRAAIIIRNTDTNVESRVQSNGDGLYEVPFLIQGTYELQVTADGFRQYRRKGISLGLGDRVSIDIAMELGETSSSVSVTAEAPILSTTNASSAQVLTNRMVADLPTMSNSVILQAGLAVGMQRLAFNNVNLSFTNASSNHRPSGAVGGNEWSIDGTPNAGQMRRAAYLPFTDAIQEMRVESMTFDATVGNNSGAFIQMTTKAGTNAFHGTLSNTHWQQRWHATSSNDNGVYSGRIRDAELAGNTELANKLRSEPQQPSGRSNTYSASLGGPVRIPKVYDGRNKLFFFFIYSGQTERFFDLEPGRKIYTVPTVAERKGDFSRLLGLDPTRYQIYDPLTTTLNSAGLFVRQPIPGNQVPLSRVANQKMYDFYAGVFPLPNNPSITDRDGNNNLLSDPMVPYDYFAIQNRVDWVPSDKDRFFFRWSWNKFANERQDWSYQTYPGLHSEALRRNNIGGTIDYVHTFSPTTLLNVTLAYNRYWDNRPLNATQWAYTPSQVGLPSYLDDKAGEMHTLPTVAVSGYAQISNPRVALLPSSIGSLRAQLSRFVGKHSMSAGYDGRIYYSLGGDSGLSYPGYTSGQFTFNNDLMRATSATAGAGTLGLGWAAFMLGVPATMSVNTNDTYYATTPRHSFYFQDSFRATNRLTLTAGLRMEYEGSIRERFNRGLRDFDPTLAVAIGGAAQAAYAANPLPERAASSFVVRGGPNFLGVNGPDTLTNPTYRFMPRISMAYALGTKMVLRAGYGMFYDSLNASHTFANQDGFSRTTSTNVTDQAGASWNYGYFSTPGNNPLTNPFPVRADGTRFDVPLGNALGSDAFLGRSFSFMNMNFQPALSHKARVELERQLSRSLVVGLSYNWGWVPNLGVSPNLNAVPEQYWASGNVRNNVIENELNRNVTNPFQLSNFAGLQASNPKLYQQLSTLSFFTSPTIRKNQLLKAYPHMTGLTLAQQPIGKNKFNSMVVRVERRFAQGLLLNAHYEWSHTMSKEWFANAYDTEPLWRESDFSRPHRFVITGIYELPFGKGKRFLASSRLGNALAGGWQIGSAYQRQSGECIDFGNLFWYGTDYRDIVLPADQRTQNQWFDTSQFERVASRVPTSFSKRAFPSRMNWLRTENMAQLDANLQKNIPITESMRASLRIDLINALNKQVLGNPGVNPQDSNFGRISDFVNTPRLIQLTFRLTF